MHSFAEPRAVAEGTGVGAGGVALGAKGTGVGALGMGVGVEGMGVLPAEVEKAGVH